MEQTADIEKCGGFSLFLFTLLLPIVLFLFVLVIYLIEIPVCIFFYFYFYFIIFFYSYYFNRFILTPLDRYNNCKSEERKRDEYKKEQSVWSNGERVSRLFFIIIICFFFTPVVGGLFSVSFHFLSQHPSDGLRGQAHAALYHSKGCDWLTPWRSRLVFLFFIFPFSLMYLLTKVWLAVSGAAEILACFGSEQYDVREPCVWVIYILVVTRNLGFIICTITLCVYFNFILRDWTASCPSSRHSSLVVRSSGDIWY